MGRRVLLALFGVVALLAALWWWPTGSASDSGPIADLAPEPETPAVIPSRPRHRPISAPCFVRGVVKGGKAKQVSLHSLRSQVDVPAKIKGGGSTFEAELPDRGQFEVVVVAQDGRSASVQGYCDSGSAVVQVRLPKDAGVPATLTGRCLYLETGVPVAEARVRGRWANSEGSPAVAALTNDEGEFALSAPAGVFELLCGKDGDESKPVRVTVQRDTTQHLELFLAARAAVTGTVRDDNGIVAGVIVRGRAARGGPRAEPKTAMTDAEGRYLLPGLTPGPVVIDAQHSGQFAEGHGVAQVDLPYAEIDLTLAESAVQLEGFIKSEGIGLEGANIEVFAVRDRRGRAPRDHVSRSVHSDGEGHYVVGGLSPGRFRVQVKAPEHAPTRNHVTLGVGSTRLDITMEKDCETELTVGPDEPSRPIWVQVQREHAGHQRLAGRTGEPLIIRSAPGEATLSIRSTGVSVSTATRSVQLCSGPVSMTLASSEGDGRLEVTTVRPDGSPVGGVRVWIAAPGGYAVTGEDGKAAFDGLEAGTYRLGTQDTEPTEAEIFEGRTTSIELRVSRESGSITGTVQADSVPVEGAAILAACADSGRPPDLSRSTVRARTDVSGAFSFTPDDGGNCMVRAEHRDRGRSQPVLLRSGGDPGLIELQASAELSGRVVQGTDAQPVPVYNLTLTSKGRAARLESRTFQVSSPDGRFEVHDLAPGRIEISVDGPPGLAHLELELQPGEKRRDLEIPLFRQGQVTGRVVDEEGAPVPLARVRIEALRRKLGRAVTDPQGGFSFSVPAGDPLRVYVSATGYYPTGSEVFDLRAGGPTDIGTLILKTRGGPEEKEGGIGIMFSGEDLGIRVIRFTEDSPAREAGMVQGDLITAIDGVPFGRDPLVNWVVTLRGLVGTPVVLEISRGTRSPFTVTVMRRSIGLAAVPNDAP